MKDSDIFLEFLDDDLFKPQDKPVNPLKLVEDKSKSISESLPNRSKGTRTEFDICAAFDNENVSTSDNPSINKNVEQSLIHDGSTDSSDDEDNKYMESCNYSSLGREIKRMLLDKESKDDHILETSVDDSADATFTKNKLDYVKPPRKEEDQVKSDKSNVKQMSLPEKAKVKSTFDCYADPFFGIRIVTPLISSKGLEIRMQNKLAVSLSKLVSHVAKNLEADFVVAGVLVRSVTKQSQNDSQYLIWELCDLKDDMIVVPVFLFGKSYKDLWKTQVGTVVAILNPSGPNKKNNGSESDSFSISVKHSDQVMIWGRSKDYGICSSLKKSGEKCTAFVNRNRCQYCVYHVKKEYSKFSSFRSEIQSSSNMGPTSINFLRNKVLGKNEVFYGGKSYSAVKSPLVSEKAKEKAKKINSKDKQRLSKLGLSVFESKLDMSKSNTVSLPLAPRAAQVLRTLNMDNKILKSLSLSTTNKPESPVSKAVSNPTNKSSLLSNFNTKTANQVPKLSDPSIQLFKECRTETKSFRDKIESKKCNNLLAKESCISDTEKDAKVTDAISSRSKLLFQQAVSKGSNDKKMNRLSNLIDSKDSEANGTDFRENSEKLTSSDPEFNRGSNKTSKPSLSDPELDKASNKMFKPSVSNLELDKKLKKLTKPLLSNPELDKNSNKTSKPLLSDPELDKGWNKTSKPSSVKPQNKSNKKTNIKEISTNPADNLRASSCEIAGESKSKDLQKRFKSLFDVDCSKRNKYQSSFRNNSEPDVNSDLKSTSEAGNLTRDEFPFDLKQSPRTECNGNDNSQSKAKYDLNKSDLNSSSYNRDGVSHSISKLSDVSLPCSNVFSRPVASKISKAKARALMFIKRNGPITKADPNELKKNDTGTQSKKRGRSDYEEGADDEKMVFSDLYLELMKQTSCQQDLVEAEKLRLEEEYFEKMGLKEQLEEKMLNTFKIDCKAVKCLQCKYIWFSAADKCKVERHILKIVDSVKRFFKCTNCGNRTVSLHVIPMFSCKNCHSSNWQRAPMMREKIVKVDSQLSIRGGEQKFVNSQITNTNLNLLMPE